jgi:hypothetical protein
VSAGPVDRVQPVHRHRGWNLLPLPPHDVTARRDARAAVLAMHQVHRCHRVEDADGQPSGVRHVGCPQAGTGIGHQRVGVATRPAAQQFHPARWDLLPGGVVADAHPAGQLRQRYDQQVALGLHSVAHRDHQVEYQMHVHRQAGCCGQVSKCLHRSGLHI